MAYPPIDGIAAYDNAVKALVFGADAEPVTSGRVATVQAIGGTGGLKIGADFLHKLNPNAKVLISDPSWENHRAIFQNAGFEVDTYAYYDAAKRGVNFDGMLQSLRSAAPGTIAVLHACCHNPTGYDITPAQWDQVIEVVKANNLVAFLDMAYQGFGHGIAEDGAVIGKFVAAGLKIFVSTSFSKKLQPVRRARGGPVGGRQRQGRSRPRALAAENRHPHQLLQPAHPWRCGGGQGAHHPGPAPAMGRGAGRHARAHQSHAPKTGRWPASRRCAARYVFHDAANRHVQLLGPDQEQMLRLRSEFGVYGTDTGRICVRGRAQ